MFGNEEYFEKNSLIYPPKHVLQRLDVFNDPEFVIFLINSLKSTWFNVRLNAYEILCLLPIKNEINPFLDSSFVNDIYFPKCLKFACNPKSNIAEASSLMLLLLCNKYIDTLDLNHPLLPEIDIAEEGISPKLVFLKKITLLIKVKIDSFSESLFKKGSK
jgi:hypothetical protein